MAISIQLSEQERIRREKLEALRTLGIDPYPSATFSIDFSAQQIVSRFAQEGVEPFQQIQVAGRILSKRVMGGASFVTIQDEQSSLQLYIERDHLCPGADKMVYNQLFKKLLDIGDIIGVKGDLFVTKTKALALKIDRLQLLSKALHPLPTVKEVVDAQGKRVRYNSFTDPEQRYRQRYLDLLLNPESKKRFEKRAEIIAAIRANFREQGYLEVETPMLQPLYGGASAEPFTTHHNSLKMPLYLRISPELYLKRLLVGGHKGVYEIGKNFRNEGMSRFHNPEFSMLELYVAYKDYRWMMDYTEALLSTVVEAVHGAAQLVCQGKRIDFKSPWKRYTFYEAIETFTGKSVAAMDQEGVFKSAQALGVKVEAEMARSQLLDKIFSACCEPQLINPTFITDHPVEMSPLAKRHRDQPELTERFELICNGKELCNAFSEENDPIEQRKRFAFQRELAKGGDKEAMQMDESFIEALTYGMPQAAGLGIGLDRLIMLLTDADSIQDVILFPQMRQKSTPQLTEPI